MTDFTQTINNRLGVYGGEPPNLWGVLVWGVDDWGWGDNLLEVDIGKVITSTVTPTTLIGFDFFKTLSDALTLTDEVVFHTERTITGSSLSLSSDMGPETLQDSEGFYHVFRGNTTDAEDRVLTDYTESDAQSSTWSVVSFTTTTWS